MKKHQYIFLALVFLGLSACEEDFLNRYPQTSISPEAFFNTEEDLALYMNGLISMPSRSVYLNDQDTDNAATTGAVEMKIMMTGTPTADNLILGWNWGRLRDINYFLDNYQKAKVADEIKNHYAGLARYYRAQFYLDKVKRYSHVPWYGKTLQPTDESLFKGRDTRATVMDSLMADLEFASSNIRASVPSGTPGKWVAKLLLSKTALYEGTYRKYHSELNLQGSASAFLQKAAATAAEIMESGAFHIHNTGKPQQDYASLFNAQDLTSNKEVMLVNGFDPTKNRSQNINSVVFGEYEQSPARDLVQSYLMKDGSRFTDQPGYEKYQFVKEFENRDPRLSQTLVYPGWVREPETRPYVLRLNKNFTGYHQLKGYANTVITSVNEGIDFPVHRYAEVLLILAEAKAELGTLTQADLDATINLLRKRAGLPDLLLDWSNANPDAFLKSKYPNVSGAYLGVLLEIRRERRVEFAFENLRFDDLMRWGAGPLLTKIPEGIYFPGLGRYDLTGDGVPDVLLVGKETTIPEEANKEKNSLGIALIYYKTGSFGEDVTVYLKNGSSGGATVTETTFRKFEEPKYYYRPVPQTQVILNPNLKQIFGW